MRSNQHTKQFFRDSLPARSFFAIAVAGEVHSYAIKTTTSKPHQRRLARAKGDDTSVAGAGRSATDLVPGDAAHPSKLVNGVCATIEITH
jgi:hypothetical protein